MKRNLMLSRNKNFPVYHFSFLNLFHRLKNKNIWNNSSVGIRIQEGNYTLKREVGFSSMQGTFLSNEMAER